MLSLFPDVGPDPDVAKVPVHEVGHTPAKREANAVKGSLPRAIPREAFSVFHGEVE